MNCKETQENFRLFFAQTAPNCAKTTIKTAYFNTISNIEGSRLSLYEFLKPSKSAGFLLNIAVSSNGEYIDNNALRSSDATIVLFSGSGSEAKHTLPL